MAEKFKITYTTLSADNEGLQSAMDAAIEKVQGMKGSTFPLLINNEERHTSEKLPIYSPIDSREPFVYFQKAGRDEARQAVAAAKAAFPVWRKTPYQERCNIVRKVAEMIDDNQFDLSAMMMIEMGKSRLEALGEVAEVADLLRYYADAMEEMDGYNRPLPSQAGNDHNRSISKPLGVWAVIAPFNFPMALAAAPVAAALVTGNTVVVKPSSDAPWTIYMMTEYFLEAGIPAGVLNFITGGGSTAGQELIDNVDVAGLTFTGSYEIGYKKVYEGFAKDYPKPVIVEMGGKNPTIVSKNADLDKAAYGVMRSAFGLGGQKCSACSRVYIEQEVYESFKEKLVALTNEKVTIGNPLGRGIYLGPVANQGAYDDYKRFTARAKKDGKVIVGGDVITNGEHAHGYYVQPTIVEDLSHDHELVREELFLPILAILPVDSLDEAMQKANDTFYGLTAGFFSENKAEQEWFLDNIEAGTVYVNRMAGATTGAWPGYQAFGGWKGSGSTGNGIGGFYTLKNYLREQSQTVIVE